jgi:hypothetical protein
MSMYTNTWIGIEQQMTDEAKMDESVPEFVRE